MKTRSVEFVRPFLVAVCRCAVEITFFYCEDFLRIIYLKPDFGRVQGERDEVGKTGRRTSAGHLYPERRGNVRGLQSHHCLLASRGTDRQTDRQRHVRVRAAARVTHPLARL